MRGGLFQELKIKKVDLKLTEKTIAATFHLLDKGATKTFGIDKRSTLYGLINVHQTTKAEFATFNEPFDIVG